MSMCTTNTTAMSTVTNGMGMSPMHIRIGTNPFRMLIRMCLTFIIGINTEVSLGRIGKTEKIGR